jgi:lipopolysaccharide transport system ATP-binding protein
MTQDGVCVAVRGVSKKFARSLKRSFLYGARDIGRLLAGRGQDDTLRPTEFWAVRDVSFELRRGRSIGIVGLNGSGKTTLLRMICGILRPTLGSVAVRGRIAPMLALGAGFKPVLSGRHNVFLNLSLLGVAERDIRTRYASIVDFAELHEAIDAPLGTYSSGMQARLGFACAVHTDPSILVVDEVLSVGDSRFRVKCRNKINDLRRTGTSLLLVSHSAILVESLSDECLYLRDGKPVMLGPPREVLKAYEEEGVRQAGAGNQMKQIAMLANGTAKDQLLSIRSVRLRANDTDVEYWSSGDDAELAVAMHCKRPVDQASVNLMVFDLVHQPGEPVLFMKSSRDAGWMRLPEGDSKLVLALPCLGLRPGTYRLKLAVSSGSLHDILDVVDDVKLVVRDAGGIENCYYFQSREWRFDRAQPCTSPVVVDEVDSAGQDEG